MLVALKTHRYIDNIVKSKIVKSGTNIFVIPGILSYRGSLHRGSTV